MPAGYSQMDFPPATQIQHPIHNYHHKMSFSIVFPIFINNLQLGLLDSESWYHLCILFFFPSPSSHPGLWDLTTPPLQSLPWPLYYLGLKTMCVIHRYSELRWFDGYQKSFTKFAEKVNEINIQSVKVSHRTLEKWESPQLTLQSPDVQALRRNGLVLVKIVKWFCAELPPLILQSKNKSK